MREKTIEEKLTKEIKKIGGICWKFSVPGTSGVPDRIILYNGIMVFIETKAPGKKPRPLQEKIHRMIREQGFPVYIIDKPEDIENLIKNLKTRKVKNQWNL